MTLTAHSISSAHSVPGKVSYLSRSVTKPFLYVYPDRPAGEPAHNFVYEQVEVPITDLRSISSDERRELGFDTEHAGFEVVDGWASAETREAWQAGKWDDEEWIRETYYADIDASMKRRGATSTFIFDHTIRKRRTDETEHLPDDPQNRKPVAQVHCDQSRRAGEHRILKHLGQETLDRVKRGEVHAQLINVWRPLRGPVVDHPLAFADFRTVEQRDWQPSELRYKDWTGETLAVHPNTTHKWYYLSNISIDEAIFLKCYDSVAETKTPHTAFVDPTSPPNAQPRWSIEVRTLVLTDLSKST